MFHVDPSLDRREWKKDLISLHRPWADSEDLHLMFLHETSDVQETTPCMFICNLDCKAKSTAVPKPRSFGDRLWCSHCISFPLRHWIVRDIINLKGASGKIGWTLHQE
jgi:hypothetical protein